MIECTPSRPCREAGCPFCDPAGYADGITGTPTGSPTTPDGSRLDRLRAQLVTSAGLDDIPEPQPLIPGVLYRDSLAWIYGAPGCGKSFMAIDMAGCVGTGEIWQTFGPAEQGQVLYLVAEGVTGVKQRVRAWEGAMGVPMTSVTFLPVAVQASNAAEWEAFVELASELRPALVVIDTQARVTVGMEENSAKEMGLFVERADQLRKATGACVLVVHHTGRNGEHMRGSIAIDGAATTTIKVEKAEEILQVVCTKQKDAPEFDRFALRLVPFGTSAILSGSASPRPSSLDTPGIRQLLAGWWESFGSDWTSAKNLRTATGAPESSFFRHIKALVDAGIAEKKGENAQRRYRLNQEPALP